MQLESGGEGFLLRLEESRGCFTHPVSHCLLSARPCGETEALRGERLARSALVGDKQGDGRALARCPRWPSVRDSGAMGEVGGDPGCLAALSS